MPVISFQADIEAYIADKTLPLTRRQLVVYQFGDPLTLPKGRGVTYTATRYNRVALPYAPLSEGVPPIGEVMTIGQVTATALQWGDKITITDVAEMTIKHPLFKKAIELLGLQVAETLERNTFNNLHGRHAGQLRQLARLARSSAGRRRAQHPRAQPRLRACCVTLGAPRYMGDEMTDTKLEADAGGAKASTNPRAHAALRLPCMHPFVEGDLRENQPIQYAWSHSDINRLYNYEVGEWSGIRFCSTNMVPSFTGVAANQPRLRRRPAVSRPTDYYIIVTASDTQNQYESQIYAGLGRDRCHRAERLDHGRAAGARRLYLHVYVGTTQRAGQSRPLRRGPDCRAVAGAGDAACRRPDGHDHRPWRGADPAGLAGTGITVYPTFIFGRGAYGQVMLDETKFTYLKEADKSDPLNQLRIVGWKCFYGTIF